MEASMMACGSKEREWGLGHSTMLTVMSFKEIGGMIKCMERFFHPTLFSVSIFLELIYYGIIFFVHVSWVTACLQTSNVWDNMKKHF